MKALGLSKVRGGVEDSRKTKYTLEQSNGGSFDEQSPHTTHKWCPRVCTFNGAHSSNTKCLIIHSQAKVCTFNSAHSSNTRDNSRTLNPYFPMY